MTHHTRPDTARHRLIGAATMLALAVAAAGCSSATAEPSAATTTSTSVAAEQTSYPLTLTSSFGETVIESKPQRVAVVDSVDQEIALALGVEPVISQFYPSYPEVAPFVQTRLTELGIDKLSTFDATDGVDFEAIAAADPDVILATSGWSLDTDYEQLAKIAPVVAYPTQDGLTSMTWEDRTLLAGRALGLPTEAAAVVADVQQKFSTAAAANPQFAGKSYIYSVIHPDQITFVNYSGADNAFFTDLGFVLPPQATEFSAENTAVSKENLDQLEADVLLIGYPFGDEGLLSRSALETDPLFASLTVVKDGGYAVLNDDVASPLAYPTPLSQPWVLDQALPLLQQVTAS